MSQPIQPDPIQPPSPNELNNLFDTLLDENVHIDGYIRNPHTSAWNQRDILNKIITVNESAHRLKEIAEWENDEAQTQYQQYVVEHGCEFVEYLYQPVSDCVVIEHSPYWYFCYDSNIPLAYFYIH
ncbi:7377_t:CDS:2 [Entrophospora sp. SA101]|nr:7377_t:CDS:2 [Entrophospora sp. SA101]